MKLNSRMKIIILSVTLAFLGALAMLGVSVAMDSETIISGVHIPGGDLSGLTRENGDALLQQLEKELVQSTPLVLSYEGKSWRLRPGNIGLSIDRGRILDEALLAGRKGSPLERLRQYRTAGKEGLAVPVYVKIDKAMLEGELDSIASEITTLPVDARLKINPDESVEIIPALDGLRVDRDKVYRSVEQIFMDSGAAPEIKLSLVRSSPKVSTQQVAYMGVDGLLSTYTTTFNPNDTDRAYNLKIAASALDGIFLPPSEIFSFNGVVGSRSTEAGYKNAKVIVNNELVDGVGGGVCQVSTTLYNAVLLANLEILDRVNHSIPVAYVPPGRDATVTDNYLDFRFKNSTPSHIYLKTFFSPGRITVKVYGNSNSRRQVIIRTNIIETIPFKDIYEKDLTLKEGEVKLKRKGIPGLRVSAERLVLDNGKEKVETLPASLYHPVNQIVLTGPGVDPIDGERPAGKGPEGTPIPGVAGGIVPGI
ncbi:MAG: VanW family protein [Desulfocucumaceae bacterium]